MVKTNELTGAALNWAVAKCEGLLCFGYRTDGDERFAVEDNDGQMEGFMPSTVWADGGPIIERERIEIRWSDKQWIAMYWADNSGMAKKPTQRFKHNQQTAGQTALIAAMRCFVASKLGDEVDVPDELMEPA